MRSKRGWARLLGVERTVVEQVELDQDADAIVAAVRPVRRQRLLWDLRSAESRL